MTHAYKSAAAFKQALEQRLRTASASGLDFARRRQLIVFDRFLARIALELGEAVTVKGGLAVELRLERARTTKDVDLRVMGSPDHILDRLRAATRRERVDLDDSDASAHACGRMSSPPEGPLRLGHQLVKKWSGMLTFVPGEG